MRELPILFKGEMVRAIMAGQKTQTRRVMKPLLRVPSDGSWWDAIRYFSCVDRWCWSRPHPGGGFVRALKTSDYPYHKARYDVGDLLWVRERQRVISIRKSNGETQIKVLYEADGTESDWLPYPARLKGIPRVGRCLAYGGYRESSFRRLEVTGVRCERVQEISEEDALAEGCVPDPSKLLPQMPGPRYLFLHLWDSINAKRGYSWHDNPYVWVYAFKQQEEPPMP